MNKPNRIKQTETALIIAQGDVVIARNHLFQVIKENTKGGFLNDALPTHNAEQARTIAAAAVAFYEAKLNCDHAARLHDVARGAVAA